MSWTQRVNRVLAGATGFEVRRAQAAPARPATGRWNYGLGNGQRAPVPQPSTSPGSMTAANFFDDYPRFMETSPIAAYRGRLNLRYEAICKENAALLQGARVLDITSHDGRWSFAALKTGAAHVTGIEANPAHVANAEENLRHYGIESDRFRFITGDVFDVLAEDTFEVDVVFCLGYLYHTLRYNELLYRIRALRPSTLLIDTEVFPDPKREVVKLGLDHKGLIFDRYTHGERILVGWPSVPALEMMLGAYGFRIERLVDWAGLVRDNPDASGVDDYAAGWRVTAVCEPTSEGDSPG